MRNANWLAVIFVIGCAARAATPGGSSSPAAVAGATTSGTARSHGIAAILDHIAPSGRTGTGSSAGGSHPGATAPATVKRQMVAGHAAAVATFKLPERLTDADQKRILEAGYKAYNEPNQTFYCRDEIDPVQRVMHCFTVISGSRR